MKQSKEPYISIIIPSYNSANTIDKTIEGIRNLNAFDKVLELIIVDSSDDQKTQPFLYSVELPILKIIVPGVRVMPGKQRNIGAEQAKGKLLVFIDSDAFPDQDWIVHIDEAYRNGIRVGGGSYLYPDFQSHMKSVVAEYYLQFNEYIPRGNPRRNKMVPSCNLFCDKELFMKVGGFPPIRASEDALFGVIVNQSEALIFYPSATVYHIFREEKQRFLNNQLLLGKFVYIYRKKHSESILYKGVFPYFLFPLFISYKALSIYLRMFKAGKGNFKNLNRSILPFSQGMLWWSKGMWQGINYCWGKTSAQLGVE